MANSRSPKNGSIQFDEDEHWTKLNLYPVAVHEIGHALGLSDSSAQNSVMKASYKTNVNLDQDDITGIQAIYGMQILLTP